VVMSMPNLKCVDFFCGGGGMSRGLADAGIKIIGALDSDPTCRETYEANHPHTTFIQRDITEMHPSELESELPIRREDDDLIFVGCSPCQYCAILMRATTSLLVQIIAGKSYWTKTLPRKS